MVGNDIVDLKKADKESNWRRKGYLQKVFTTHEQEFIKLSVQPDVVVWVLWSMKEAVYKLHFRKTLIREYAPLKIACLDMEIDDEHVQGRVSYGGTMYYTFTYLLGDHLHTVACLSKADFSIVKRIVIENYPDDYLPHLKKKQFISSDEFIVKNNFGVPNLINKLHRKIYPASISHHGKYLAAVFIFKDLD